MKQGLCPTCGAVANLTIEQAESKCVYCGSINIPEQAEYELKQGKNSKAGALLLLADSARDGKNYDEAISYYNRVIEQDSNYAYAWLQKGICLARQTTPQKPKIGPARSAWQTTIEVGKGAPGIRQSIIKEILMLLRRTIEEFDRDMAPDVEDCYALCEMVVELAPDDVGMLR